MSKALLASLRLQRIFPGVPVRFYTNEGLLSSSSSPEHVYLWFAHESRHAEVIFSKRLYDWEHFSVLTTDQATEFPKRPFSNAVLVYPSYFGFDLTGEGELFDQIIRICPSAHFAHALLEEPWEGDEVVSEEPDLELISHPIQWGMKAFGVDLMNMMRKTCVWALIDLNLSHRKNRHEIPSGSVIEELREDYGVYLNFFEDIALISFSNNKEQRDRMFQFYEAGFGEDFIYVTKALCDHYNSRIKLRFDEQLLLNHLISEDPYFPRL